MLLGDVSLSFTQMLSTKQRGKFGKVLSQFYYLISYFLFNSV